MWFSSLLLLPFLLHGGSFNLLMVSLVHFMSGLELTYLVRFNFQVFRRSTYKNAYLDIHILKLHVGLGANNTRMFLHSEEE